MSNRLMLLFQGLRINSVLKQSLMHLRLLIGKQLLKRFLLKAGIKSKAAVMANLVMYLLNLNLMIPKSLFLPKELSAVQYLKTSSRQLKRDLMNVWKKAYLQASRWLVLKQRFTTVHTTRLIQAK